MPVIIAIQSTLIMVILPGMFIPSVIFASRVRSVNAPAWKWFPPDVARLFTNPDLKRP
jgi:hypothetical protein